MPPPPSDKQLLSSFTSEEWEFYHWYEENEKNLADCKTPLQELNFMRSQFRDPEQRKRYNLWSDKWLSRGANRRMYRMTPQDFIDTICNTKFMSRKSTSELNFVIELHNIPVVLLGEGTFDGLTTGYALQPGTDYLWPDQDAAGGELADRRLLAVNLNVKVNPQGHFSRQCVDPQRSDNFSNTHSLMGVQIGALYQYAGDWKTARDQDRETILEGPWRETSYGVIATVNTAGRVEGGLWAIYNCWEVDKGRHTNDENEPPDTMKRKRRPFDESKAGYINGAKPSADTTKPRPVFVAKLIDDIHGVGDYIQNYQVKLGFASRAAEPRQIVRVKRWTSEEHGSVLTPQYVPSRT